MANVSVKLDELLLDDCHVRYALSLLKELNDDLALRAKAIQQSCSSRTRFLPTIGRPEELAALETARNELAKAASAQESLIKLHAMIDAQLPSELEIYVRSVSPAYVRGEEALEALVTWPDLMDRLTEKLTGLLHALGTARNMVSSGYDWQRRVFSVPANEAIERALACAADLDEVIFMLNSRVDRHELEVANTPHAAATLPRVPVVGFQARIQRVQNLGIAEVQAEFNAILEMCGLLESTGLTSMRDATHRMAEVHAEQSRAYLQAYLEQLRTFMDEKRLVPAETTARIRRLQQQYLGAANFPFELGL